MASSHCQALQSRLPRTLRPEDAMVAVISRWDENVSWAWSLPIPALVYEHAKPAALHNVPLNRGSEASAYLQYMIDHYECLPAWTLFLHGHGQTRLHEHTATTRLLHHHPLPPSHHSALLDVARMRRARQIGGFVSVTHLTADDAIATYKHARKAHWFVRADADRNLSNPRTDAYGVPLPYAPPFTAAGRHYMGYMGSYLRRGVCVCSDMAALELLPAERTCLHEPACREPQARDERWWVCGPDSWPASAEFWLAADRIRSRPRAYWRRLLAYATGGPIGYRRASTSNGCTTVWSACVPRRWEIRPCVVVTVGGH